VGRNTLYELVAECNGRSVLIAYCSRRGRRDIWNAVTSKDRVHHVIRLTGADQIAFAKKACDGGAMGQWKIRFSGRTQRDAIVNGELPYVVDLA
jgi:hypothetical protein